MHEDGRLVLREIDEPRLVDGRGAIPDRPRRPLGLLVDLARHVLGRIRDRVVVAAAEQAVPVDREAEERARVGLLRAGDGEHAERPPLVVGGHLRIGTSRRRQRGRLGGVLRRRADERSLRVDAVVAVLHRRAIVVGHGSGRIAAPAGEIAPREPREHADPEAPAESAPPSSRPPGREIASIPAAIAVPVAGPHAATDRVATVGETVHRVGPHGIPSDAGSPRACRDPLEVGARQLARAREVTGPAGPRHVGPRTTVERSSPIEGAAGIQAAPAIERPAAVEPAATLDPSSPEVLPAEAASWHRGHPAHWRAPIAPHAAVIAAHVTAAAVPAHVAAAAVATHVPAATAVRVRPDWCDDRRTERLHARTQERDHRPGASASRLQPSHALHLHVPHVVRRFRRSPLEHHVRRRRPEAIRLTAPACSATGPRRPPARRRSTARSRGA